MMRAVIVLTISLAGAGCSDQIEQIHQIGREPALTPIGAGLWPARTTVPIEVSSLPEKRRDGSIWQDNGVELFRDPRAARPGDIVTVQIRIDDKAELDSSTNRTRKSARGVGFDAEYDFALPFLKGSGDGNLTTTFDGSTSSDGKGGISRKEEIEFKIAAVVSEVLPNGNLIISGSQEVRVNYEVRIVSVAGVVRPRDISSDNAIPYEKIAEARISYGGRGRIMDVQQPGWGQQALDILSPF